MDDDQLAAMLPALLQAHWQITASSIVPLGGGMNSATALVTTEGKRWVAKWVISAADPGFVLGLDLAGRLTAGGLRAGRARPTIDGEPRILVGDGSLALLEHVPGRELTVAAGDQAVTGEALARAHTLLGTTVRRAPFLPGLGDDPRLGQVADWILPAIHQVTAEYLDLPDLTWGMLHGDPSVEAFLADEITGEVGIIDWAGAGEGPLLYDVASALMYLGGRTQAAPFLWHYLANAPLPAGELEAHLETLSRFRGIVQADYFGRRILTDDRTGIDDPAENRKGLDGAHEMLRELGVV